MIVEASTSEIIGLDDFLRYLERHLDVTSERSVLAAAPKLLALARNQQFLADYLCENLAIPGFQAGNHYAEPILCLGGGSGYLVRAVGWPPARTDESEPVAELSAASQAHNH